MTSFFFPKPDIKSLLPEELTAELKGMGLPAFRARQIFAWLSQGAASFEEMTNLPKELRRDLSERYMIPCLTMQKKQEYN